MTMHPSLIPLQACGIEGWATGSWQQCIFGATTGLIGESVFGLLVGAGVLVAFYFAGDGNATTPAILLILMAGMLFGILPAGLRGVAWAVAFLGGVAAVISVFQRYVLSPATQ